MLNVLHRIRRSRWRVAALALVASGAVIAAGGCGKKGPPLAPVVRLPSAPDPFSARRLGSTVYVRLAVPTRNQDNSQPADISRVEVYGYTGTPDTDDDMVKYGTLVATLAVRRPPPPEEEDRARDKNKPDARAKRPKVRKPAEQESGFEQGATVTVTEMLSEPLMKPVTIARRRAKAAKTTAMRPPMLMPVASVADLPLRVYVAVAVSRKGRRGAFSRHAAVPLVEPPAPPVDLELSQSETAITLNWKPGADAPASLPDESEQDVALLPVKRLPFLAVATWSYEVFEVPPKKPAEATPAAPPPGVPPPVDLPATLNQQPVTGTTYTDPRIAFGTERCYVVRAVKTMGTLREESDPSREACITPRDTYPPKPPKGLTAVVNPGAVSLIWDPNTESDLDGYYVLRADAPGGTLQRLTRDPIHETTFNDTAIRPGTRYVYAVVAVDKAGNASAESNRVEETAR